MTSHHKKSSYPETDKEKLILSVLGTEDDMTAAEVSKKLAYVYAPMNVANVLLGLEQRGYDNLIVTRYKPTSNLPNTYQLKKAL